MQQIKTILESLEMSPTIKVILRDRIGQMEETLVSALRAEPRVTIPRENLVTFQQSLTHLAQRLQKLEAAAAVAKRKDEEEKGGDLQVLETLKRDVTELQVFAAEVARERARFRQRYAELEQEKRNLADVGRTLDEMSETGLLALQSDTSRLITAAAADNNETDATDLQENAQGWQNIRNETAFGLEKGEFRLNLLAANPDVKTCRKALA